MHARSLLLAFVCYAGLSAWFHWDLLRAPGAGLPVYVAKSEKLQSLQLSDEQMVAGTIGSAARRLLTAPSRIHDLGQCYPFPNWLTLGEPMFVDALVGAAPFALTRSPIVAKNVVTITAPVLGGVFMFALVLYWTGSVAAALVAGLLFGFEPSRLADVSHPYVHGNVWAPLALLAAHRLLARRRWLDAALLAIALTLQMLESLYPALALAFVGGAYGIVLAAHYRRALPGLLPKLAAVGLSVAVVGLFAFRPYFETQEVWGALQGRGSLLLLPAQFHFGADHYPGTVLVALAAAALLDRVRRGPTVAFDPRLPLLVGGALVYWLVVWGIAIPFVGAIPSPYLLGLSDLPGISAVRVVTAVRTGIPFVGSCLAGLGLAMLLRGRQVAVRAALGVLVFALALGEIFFFPRSGPLFGARFRTVPAKPSAALLTLLDSLPPGPVLDVPSSGYLAPNAHYLLLHGFHGHPTDACYNSFSTPLRDQVHRMSARLPDSVAALKLLTVGFGAMVVHTELLGPEGTAEFIDWADGYGRRFARLQRIGEADGHLVYAFRPWLPPAGLDALSFPPTLVDQRVQTLDAPGKALRFDVRNTSPRFYRHPDPIRPDRVLVTWRDDHGAERASEQFTTLLPIALTPGETQHVALLPTALPPPGTYTVTLSLPDVQGLVLMRQRVTVAAG